MSSIGSTKASTTGRRILTNRGRRERILKRFKSLRTVQRFLSIHDQIANVFTRRPNQDTAIKFRSARNQAFTAWDEVTGVAMAT